MPKVFRNTDKSNYRRIKKRKILLHEENKAEAVQVTENKAAAVHITEDN